MIIKFGILIYFLIFYDENKYFCVLIKKNNFYNFFGIFG